MSTLIPQSVTTAFRLAHSEAMHQLENLKNPERVSFPLGTLREAAAHFSAEQEFGFTYGRTGMPANAILETLMTKMLGGAGSIAVATGQAANVMALEILLAKPGDELIMTSRGFGGTLGWAQNELPRRQNVVHFADPIDTKNFAKLVNDKTRAIFVEMVSNADGVVADIKSLSSLARAYNIPLVVDNTLCPLLADPIALGADVVTTSLTKYTNGYGDALGGIITQGGTFNFKGDARWPVISDARGKLPSLADTFNDTALIAALRQRLTMCGASMDGGTARKILVNMEDLDERMSTQVANGQELIRYLKAHEQIEWVHHLSQPDHPSFARGQEYLHAAPPLMMIKLRGGQPVADNFVQKIQLIRHEANIGPIETLVVHPDDTTHRKMSAEQKAAARIEPGALRLSVGTEDIEDLIADFDQALQPGL